MGNNVDASNVIYGKKCYTNDTNKLTGVSGIVSVLPPDEVQPINRITISGQSYDIGMNEDAFADAMRKYMKKHEPIFYKLTCQGCGATVSQRINDHILKCPYCKSVYAVGTKMVNMR